MSLDLFSSSPAGTENAAGSPNGKAASRGAGGGKLAGQRKDLSPSALNALARDILEGSLPSLWVAGEVAGWTRHRSGHCYFAIRDADAQIRCVMFRSDARRLPTDPEEGMKVRVNGTATLYERRGEFQLRCRALETAGGDGLWRLAFERLREKLEAEGLLAPERKRPLPRHPLTVGVVTSPGGAALHDVVRVIRGRAPWTRVVCSPCRVQGDGSAAEIAAAIGRFGRGGNADVLVVGRGGGSVEDLWAFNEEPVARAIVASAVPVVSAVGHETDVTIADLVADARAATPSAAGELVVPDHRAVRRELDGLRGRLEVALRSRTADRVRAVATGEERLVGAMRRSIDRPRERLHRLGDMLDALSPLNALRRGYAVPLSGEGRVLRRAGDFEKGASFRLKVSDGRVDCRVQSVEEDDG